MGLLKAKVDGAWVEIAGVGMPPGGTTGQVLTKSSAADYATAWTSNQPILANNTFLQGYKADGTTAQNLIGVTTSNTVYVAGNAPALVDIAAGALSDVYLGYGAQGHIYIGPNLAVGKSISMPRLDVQGAITLWSGNWLQDEFGKGMVAGNTDGNIYFANNAICEFNNSAGLTRMRRALECYADVRIYQNLNVDVAIYRTAVGAYTFPDFVFEHAFTGGIERFRDAPGAESYEGLWPLARVEEFAEEHWRLPGHAPREEGRVDVFRRTHDLLAECERIYLHLFEHERRLAALEER